MSPKLSLETEIEFFIDDYNAMSFHFWIENVQSNMIAKMECFSDHCHIAPDQLGLARLFPVWTILCAQLWNVCIQAKGFATISWYLW